MQERDRVFESFYRLSEHTEDGSGIGLSIVRQIAASSGAEVSLGDSEAGGLLVRIVFPMSSS